LRCFWRGAEAAFGRPIRGERIALRQTWRTKWKPDKRLLVDFYDIFQHAKAEKRNKLKTRESGKTRALILQHMVGRIRQKAQARSLPVHGPPP
jgi:hypothetical protein